MNVEPGFSPRVNQHPKRRDPWGDRPDPRRANFRDTGIGTTSAVGCFPGGASPYGVQDMSGNVWEWTRSLWGQDRETPQFKYPYEPEDGRENLQARGDVLRVVRGGSFYHNRRWLVRCAYRNWYGPDNWGWDGGFRVVVAPVASDLWSAALWFRAEGAIAGGGFPGRVPRQIGFENWPSHK